MDKQVAIVTGRGGQYGGLSLQRQSKLRYRCRLDHRFGMDSPLTITSH